jgi:diguanylate cyclase (GGDEF)-like protein/PAS domain S-box-containing protein
MWFAVLNVFCLSVFAAQVPLVIDKQLSRVDLLKSISWLTADKRSQLSDVKDLQDWQSTYVFAPLPESKSLWGKVQLNFTSDAADRHFLNIGNPQLNLVDVYVVDEKNRILNSYLMGANRDLSRRPYNHRLFVVPIDPNQGQHLSVYLKISDDGPLVFPVNLSSQADIVTQEQILLAVIGFISGALGILACYFLITYVVLRSPIRFWFAVSSGTFLILFLNVQGVISQLTGISAYISNVTSVLIAFLLLSSAKVSFSILAKVPVYWHYTLYSIALLVLVCAFNFNSYQQTLAAAALSLVSIVLITLLSVFYRRRDNKVPNTVYAAGVLLIAATGLVQVSLYLSGVSANVYLSLVFTFVLMVGIVLVALAIEAHERALTFRHSSQQQDTISDLQYFYDLFRNSAEGLYTSSLDGKLLTINPAMCSLFGYADEDKMLANVSNTTEFYANSQDREHLLGEIHQHGVVLGKEIKGLRKDGSEFWFSISAQIKQDQEQKFMFGSIFDITERKQSNISLAYLATHDSLTGVYNRREFERRLGEGLSNAQNLNTELTLLYMDFDQFKVINDTCGHKAGDILLKQLSQKLNDVVMQRGMLARLGGDEFGVLLEGDNAQMSYLVANKLLTAAQEFRFIWENRIFTLGISIGQVPWQADIKTSEQLLNMADSACYMAKERGRNQVHTYSQEDEHMQRHASELAWLSHINYALEHDGFELYYQHYHSLSKVSSGHRYEILLRMRDQEEKQILPSAFFPAAERYNLTAQIDRWTVNNYFKWLAAHPLHKAEINRCNINLSGHSLADKELKLFILNAFEKYSIPYNIVCFEITESMAIVKMDDTLEFIQTFHQLGCFFALDDFGSSFSSYSYLKNLPVDQVKIDGSFVKDILIDPIDMAMVSSINDVAKAMGIETVAEFVESKEIMVELGKMGVDYAQGFGVSRPAPIEEFSPYTG